MKDWGIALHSPLGMNNTQHTDCSHCENLGHSTTDCSRGQPKPSKPKLIDKLPTTTNTSTNPISSGPSKDIHNSGLVPINSDLSKKNLSSGPIPISSGLEKKKANAHMEWIQKGRPKTNVVSQQLHSPAATNALVIYSAPVIATANSFAALNSDISDGLGNEDVQEDILVRASMGHLVSTAMDSTQASPSSPGNLHDKCYDTGIDDATASESEEDC